jgi:hypothetical protein
MLEAVLGAVYLDGGLDPARHHLCQFFVCGLWPTPPETFRPRDFKSLLQEATQRIWKARPPTHCATATVRSMPSSTPSSSPCRTKPLWNGRSAACARLNRVRQSRRCGCCGNDFPILFQTRGVDPWRRKSSTAMKQAGARCPGFVFDHCPCQKILD